MPQAGERATANIGRFAEKKKPLKPLKYIEPLLGRKERWCRMQRRLQIALHWPVRLFPLGALWPNFIRQRACVNANPKIDHLVSPFTYGCQWRFFVSVPTKANRVESTNPILMRLLNVFYRCWLFAPSDSRTHHGYGAFHCETVALMPQRRCVCDAVYGGEYLRINAS